MNDTDPRLGAMVLLGEDFDEYGTISSARVGSRAAVAISVGSDQNSPSAQFKHDPTVMNEDALCIIEGGTWAGYAVADAHYGPESSHMLISRLDKIWAKVQPNDLNHLGQMLDFLRQGDPARTDSETTLLVAVYDRVKRTGFGFSFGDSSFVVAGPGRTAQAVNEKDSRYVTTRVSSSMRGGNPFQFSAEEGDVLLAFTDGIDECHYRNPQTSVQPHHIADIAEAANGDSQQVVTELSTLALAGVDGNPGGQDNIAVICAQA